MVVVRARPPVGSPAPGPANRTETQRGGRRRSVWSTIRPP